jgi:hypothetical protein
MHRLKLLVLALMAALAMAVLASASASAALPEFSTPGFSVTLKGGEVRFTSRNGAGYGCAGSSGEFHITGVKTATVQLTFTQCEGPNLVHCQSPGSPAGEIRTGTLPVELVYLSKERHEAGLDVNYGTPKSTTIAKWTCGFAEGLGIRNYILAPVTPVNTKTTSFTVKFAEAGQGEQNPRFYEGEAGEKVFAFPEEALLSSFYEEGMFRDLVKLTAKEAYEVKA